MTDQILPAILKCRICDDAADGQHFGVDACRACAAFFRRTVARDMKYICSFENNCEISKVYRSMCRSCRLQKCLQSGMKRESVKISRTSVPDANSRQDIPCMSDIAARRTDKVYLAANGISKFHVELQIAITHDLPNEGMHAELVGFSEGIHKCPIVTALLDRYRAGFLNFTNGQRSLYSVKSASTIFAEIKYKRLMHAEYLSMNRGSAFLLHTMCINYFEPFNILPQDKKVEILKKYWPIFTFLHRAYLTVTVLGPYVKKASQDGNDTSNNGRTHVFDKYISHYGYYTDKNQTRELFEAMNLDRDDCEKGVRFCEALLDINLCLIDQFYELNPSEMEFVAMVAIFFWNTVDHLQLLNADMRRRRDTVFQELNSILTESLGTVNGSIRLGRIICFMHKLAAKISEMYESVTVVKIFLPQLQDMWDEEIVPK
ncbi:zinc finger, c4 type (two domains) domain-containing protein [Ditylenchus destructor]|nr:zinc finger, c4 type (two domains) domain-containing protein [Ditylenchus destructor]